MIQSKEDINSIKSVFELMIDNGSELKKDKWNSDNLLMKSINYNLVSFLDKLLERIGKKEEYYVRAGSGNYGTWSNNPYVAILDKNISKFGKKYTPTLGIYPTIMFSKDCQNIYLLYMMSEGTKTEREIKKLADGIRSEMDTTGYKTSIEELDLGDKKHHYKEATICFIKYSKETLPGNEEIESQIIDLIRLHEKYKNLYKENTKKMWN